MKSAALNKLKERANVYVSPNGHITFYMNPIRSIRHDWLITELDRVRPRAKWTHDETGKVVHEMPEEVKLEKLRQQKMNDSEAMPTGWIETFLWTELENVFIVLETHTIDIEFKGGDLTEAEQALRTYWQTDRSDNIAESFAFFEYGFMSSLTDLVWTAYIETRPTTLAAPSPEP